MLSGRRIILASVSGQLGGMELRMTDEARLLRDLGHEVCLLTPQFDGAGEWHEELRNEGIEADTFTPAPFLDHWPWRRVNHIKARLLGVPNLRRRKPDLVHVFQSWTNQGLTLLWLAHVAGARSVVSVRGSFPPADFTDWHEPHLKAAFSSVRGIFGISDSALKRYQEIFGRYIDPQSELCVIHNFVDVHRFFPSAERRSATRRRYGWNDSDFVIGCISRLSEEKQPMAVINVLAAVRRSWPDVHLAFVGTGHLESDLRKQARELDLEHFVHFLGWHPNVEEILPAFDVHTLMSRHEGFGTVSAEAMACGVPVVATRVPGTIDVVGSSEGGVLVPLGDEKSAAAAIIAVRADRARRERMASAGRAHIESHFSKQTWQKAVSAFYARMLANGDATRSSHS